MKKNIDTADQRLLNMRIALVYDWLDTKGGAERVLNILNEIFPNADIFTSYFNRKKSGFQPQSRVFQSWMQYIPAVIRDSRLCMTPLYGHAFEQFDFSEYDIVISITSSFAKSILTKPCTTHICYLLSPTRFLWNMSNIYLHSSFLVRHAQFLLTPMLNSMRQNDYIAAQRPDSIISISSHIQQYCKKYYSRTSSVVYPPFDMQYWSTLKAVAFTTLQKKYGIPSHYFLAVTRLVPQKNIEMLLEYFSAHPESHLVLAGTGRMEKEIRSRKSANVTMTGYIFDNELITLYKNARCFIAPQEEDFGYTALEALYFGCPVVAYGNSGIAEIVTHGLNGIIYSGQTTDDLHNALVQLHTLSYNEHARDVHALELKFGVERFKNEFLQCIFG